MTAMRVSKQVPACKVESQVIVILWQCVDQLLMCGDAAVDESIWLLMSTLPNVGALDTQQMPQLAQLHLKSASSLMATVKLLAPSAFPAGADSPDESLLSNLDSSLLSMVSCLIELQLFHLQRAAHLSATIRRRAKLAQALVFCGSCNSSGKGSSGCPVNTEH